jgi:hypothetical protein
VITARLLPVLCWMALGLLMLAGPVAAKQPAPISAKPAAVTFDAKGDGSVALSNELGAELQLQTSVVDEDGTQVAGATAVPSGGSKLAPGATTSLAISVPSAPATASLVVVAASSHALPEGAVLRVPLAKTAPATPAVEEWTVTLVHAGGDHGTELPLTGTCAGLGLDKPTQVGTVQADGASRSMMASCMSPTAKTVTLSTKFRATDGRDYKGTVQFGDSKVDLTVVDTLSWSLAALLIVIGIAGALFIGRWQGSGRAVKEIARKSSQVEDLVSPRNPGSADRGFVKAASELGLPGNVRAWTIADAVRAQLAVLRESLRGSPTDDQITAAQQTLDALELSVRQWPGVANTLGELKHRLSNLAALGKYVKGIEDRTLKREGPLDLAAMSDIAAAATEAATLAGDWPTEAIATGTRMAQDLEAGEARTAMDVALEQLDEAGSVTSARAGLDRFWKAYYKVRDAHEFTGRVLEAAMPAAGAAPSSGFFEPVATDDPAMRARALGVQIFSIDLVVLAVLLAAALVAGMQALWVGKSFGGFWDIAAALVWGFGSGAISATLSFALGNLGQSWTERGAEA